MRIIQINEYCGTGSTGKICMEIAQMIEAEGGICKIAYGRMKACENAQKYGIRITSDIGVRCHGIQTRIFDNHAFASSFETIRFLRFLDEFKPDLIHLHNLHGYYINIAILFEYLKNKHIPVVWTLHDCWTMTGHCSHFYQIGCNKWKSGCYECSRKKEYPASFFVDSSKKNWKKKQDLFIGLEKMIVVTPSEWLAGIVKQSYLKNYPVKTIANGIDLDVFFPRLTGQLHKKYGEKKILLGVAGIWNENKGANDFIELANRLDEKIYQIVLVGKKDKKISFPMVIEHIERIENADALADLYSGADMYLNLSRIEVLGTTSIEALACGCPVITYKAGGNSESIDESCGKVIEDGDIDLVVAAIEELLIADQDRLKKSCVQRASRFDKRRMNKEYKDLYDSILKREKDE